MFTYRRYPQRVRAVEIVHVDTENPKQVIDARGDHRVLSTSRASAGDYIIFETDIEDTRTNTVCEQWVPRSKFLADYYME